MTLKEHSQLQWQILQEWFLVDNNDELQQFVKRRLFEPNEYLLRSLIKTRTSLLEPPCTADTLFHESLHEISQYIHGDQNEIKQDLYKIFSLIIHGIKKTTGGLDVLPQVEPLSSPDLNAENFSKLLRLLTFTQYFILKRHQTNKSNVNITDNIILKDTAFIDIYHYTSTKNFRDIEKRQTMRLRNSEFNDPNENVPENVFIACFSLLKDHPTLWRLYGDDTKGVCLHFQLDITTINYNNFPFLISYEEKHFKKFIEKITETTSEVLKESSTQPKRDAIKHLEILKSVACKDIAYKDEHELRIYNYKAGHDRTTVDIKFKDLGLKLMGIIRGHNCSENQITLENSEYYNIQSLFNYVPKENNLDQIISDLNNITTRLKEM